VGSSGGCPSDTDGFGIASGWVTKKLVASGRLSGLHRYMSLRWRSVSIFSKIVISAPVIKRRTRKVLVSSYDARNAEGEKEKVTNFSILLVEPACRGPPDGRLLPLIFIGRNPDSQGVTFSRSRSRCWSILLSPLVFIVLSLAVGTGECQMP